MLLRDAYEYLKQRNLIGSHREFSTDFLSRRPRHCDDLICAGRRPSPTVLASLAVRLGDVALQMRSRPGAEQEVAELEGLIIRAFAEMRAHFVTVLPRKRPAMNILTWFRK